MFEGGEYQYRVLLTISMMMISSKAAASLPRESLLLDTSLVSRSRPDRGKAFMAIGGPC